MAVLCALHVGARALHAGPAPDGRARPPRRATDVEARAAAPVDADEAILALDFRAGVEALAGVRGALPPLFADDAGAWADTEGLLAGQAVRAEASCRAGKGALPEVADRWRRAFLRILWDWAGCAIVHEPVAVVIDVVANFPLEPAAPTTGVQHAFVELAVAIVVLEVADLDAIGM